MPFVSGRRKMSYREGNTVNWAVENETEACKFGELDSVS